MSALPLRDDLMDLRDQLGKGSVRRAYRSILRFMSNLRAHFAASLGDRAVSGLYQGAFDMTYFALLPPKLTTRGLKLAVVFDYKSFGFEVWLAARNRTVQRRYWQVLRDNAWSKHSLVEPAVGVDAIVVSDVADALDLETPEVLTMKIEAAAQAFLDDVVGFLDIHDPPEAV